MAVEIIHNPDRKQFIVFHMSTNLCLSSYIELGDSEVMFPRRRAAFAVSGGTVGAVMAVNIFRNNEL